ncbi:NusG domain II-containing protein [Butyrivibrio sp. AE2005]|uniref:NusG domain II-containing protein n=1 Tax=Butyrivibrio sp. AE2005 TaxID=1496722 RepID=UPI00047C8813|nr:NusG domain II-containing protein [Butyrivibrio sp. AE2005]
MDKKLFKKNDLILIIFLTLTSVVMLIGISLFSQKGATVVVSVDGKEVASFPLDEDTVYNIGGYHGGENILEVKDGKAHLTDASCPDKLCVSMGYINKSGQSIICLPNKVVIEIKGNTKDNNNFDTISE